MTKAAEAVYISQSGLNQQLLKLESELGAPLFYRGKKNLRLTPAGEIYVRNARVMRRLITNTEEQIRDLSQSPGGKLTLGLPSTHPLAVEAAPYGKKPDSNRIFSLNPAWIQP